MQRLEIQSAFLSPESKDKKKDGSYKFIQASNCCMIACWRLDCIILNLVYYLGSVFLTSLFFPPLAQVCDPCLALKKQKFALMGKIPIKNWRQLGVEKQTRCYKLINADPLQPSFFLKAIQSMEFHDHSSLLQ